MIVTGRKDHSDLSLTLLFIVIFPVLLLLLMLSPFSVILNISLHNTALAIPNKLLTNNTIINNQLNGNNNHPPIAHNVNITTIRNAPVGFTLNGTDPDGGDRLNYTIIAKPAYGNITSFDPSSGGGVYKPSIYPVMGVLEPRPTLSTVGTDAFAFKVTDSKGAMSNAAIVTIISRSK